MDISTGHMVLAYMEDHLKNKQRLEQEWVALCGYEAEPSSTTTAFKVRPGLSLQFYQKLTRGKSLLELWGTTFLTD